MNSSAATGEAYLFGHSEEETQRLLMQSRLFNPSTRRMLVEAGVVPGMTVLDVGSGEGDVALLVADVVGPSGTVVGVDSNPRILEVARARVATAGLHNISFLTGDIGQVTLDREFDAGGRALRALLPPRPGGNVAPTDRPAASRRHHRLPGAGQRGASPRRASAVPLLDRMWAWILELYRRAGMDLDAGLRVFHHFRDAGLPAPEMHLDAAVGGGPDWGTTTTWRAWCARYCHCSCSTGSRRRRRWESRPSRSGCDRRWLVNRVSLRPGASSRLGRAKRSALRG